MTGRTARALGDFLRQRREALAPVADGARRRRTAGMRREEVAEAAGIGVDWYTRLEQGRAVRPSTTTVDALARALKLNVAERAHLRALAQQGRRAPFATERAPAALRTLVGALAEPAYVTGQRWDLLCWNDAAARLFRFSRDDARTANSLVGMLTGTYARRLFGSGWESEARRMVAQFRAAYDLWAGDPAFEEIVAQCRAGCPEFSAWWRTHPVALTGSGQKTLRAGARTHKYAYATFQWNDDPAFKLAIYTRL